MESTKLSVSDPSVRNLVELLLLEIQQGSERPSDVQRKRL